jgi:hypothetical protein
VGLSSPQLQPAARKKIEADIIAGKKVNGPMIRQAEAMPA